MLPILIGSQALQLNLDLDFKDKSDFDFVSEKRIYIPGRNVEVHSPEVLLNHELEKYISHEAELPTVGKFSVLSLKGLSIVKRSHLHRDWFFDKHIAIYHKQLKIFQELYTTQDFEYLWKRTTETKKYFKDATPKLNKTKEEFFDDFVTKKYDHDYLHELFAYYEKPLYVSLQTKENSVWCAEENFFKLSEDDRNKTVAEECFVIATERFMIPSKWTHSPSHAFYKALKKVCTTLTSGWFRDHAIDNFEEIFALFDKSKIMKVKEILND